MFVVLKELKVRAGLKYWRFCWQWSFPIKNINWCYPQFSASYTFFYLGTSTSTHGWQPYLIPYSRLKTSWLCCRNAFQFCIFCPSKRERFKFNHAICRTLKWTQSAVIIAGMRLIARPCGRMSSVLVWKGGWRLWCARWRFWHSSQACHGSQGRKGLVLPQILGCKTLL